MNASSKDTHANVGNNGSHEPERRESLAEKRIFTTGEAAEVCKVSQQTIIRCFDNGRLGGFRVPGSKFRRIPRAELIKFMKNNSIPLGALEGAAKRVLVVDDDPQILDMFKDLLSRETYEDGTPRYDVRACATGYDAGMLTEAFRPHLVILDYLLPDVNGDLVCRRLREREDLKDTRVLFVSGVVAENEERRLRDAGADGLIRKPFDLPTLLARISELVAR